MNLIPYNPVAGIPYRSVEDKTIQLFYQVLTEAKIPTVRRFPRGRGVSGACGQLGASLFLKGVHGSKVAEVLEHAE